VDLKKSLNSGYKTLQTLNTAIKMKLAEEFEIKNNCFGL
jgi:hypothetical protein